jgi:alkylation response protein AidB-like acyl-CoA dehydrogenase
MAFFQSAPRLGNQFDDDPLLQEYLERKLPKDLLSGQLETYRELGELGGGELYEAMLADRLNEPELTAWDAWGQRIDRIEVSPLWQRAERMAAEYGFVATGYDRAYGPHARVHQFALNYLVQPSLDVYSCPLAMTDGAAKTLLESGNQALIDRALPHLTARDAAQFWTSGQWMTERTGGSDVGASETLARKEAESWRLYGTKWFTSATTSQMTLTLARPEGNGPGGRGLALFYLELRDADGRLKNIEVNRLKDKLGTRKVPTAELHLQGVEAIPVAGLENGIKNISPMLSITRTWNAMGAIWGMRRCIALALDYAHRRKAFGSLLAEKPLHVDTLSSLVAEARGAFLMAFKAAEMLGAIEAGESKADDERLFRLLTPIIKLTTAKQAVAVASEAIESFGGAGYVEDTGLPRLLADAQVLPIWEGTTNVLSLDTLRALSKDPEAFTLLQAEIHALTAKGATPKLQEAATHARQAIDEAGEWLMKSMNNREELEAGARRFAMSLGRTYQLSLLCDHANWLVDAGRSAAAATAAAQLFCRNGANLIRSVDADPMALLRG